MTLKTLTIHLLKEELKNKYIVYSLQKLGIGCSFYLLDISHVVLQFAGFKKVPDSLYNWYLTLLDKAFKEITYSNFCEMTDKVAEEINKKLENHSESMNEGEY